MKVTLWIEEGNGQTISTYSYEPGEKGGEVVCTASAADMLMCHGLSYEQANEILGGWWGVRFRAKIEP